MLTTLLMWFLIIHTLDMGLVLGNKTVEPSTRFAALMVDLVSISLAATGLIIL